MLLHGSAPNYTAWKQKKLDQLLLKRACHHCSTVISVIGVSPTRLHPMDSAGGAYSNSHSSDCHCWNDGKNEPGQDPRNSAAGRNYDSDPWGCFSSINYFQKLSWKLQLVASDLTCWLFSDSRSKVLYSNFKLGVSQPTYLYNFSFSLCGVTQGNPAKHKLGARLAQVFDALS